MTTFGVSTEITTATDKTRSNLSSFYKSFSTDLVKINAPVTIAAEADKDFDLTDNSFVAVIPDSFGLENEVLEIILTDSEANTFTLKQVGFLLLSCSNLVSMNIKNTSLTQSIDITVIF
jgi:hypothetical protein